MLLQDDLATVGVRDGLRDGEAEARAVVPGALAGTAVHEALEQPAAQRGGHARSRVLYIDVDHVRRPFNLHCHGALRRCVPEGVVEQVEQQAVRYSYL